MSKCYSYFSVSVFVCPLAPVEDVPEAAAHDKEPRVGVAVPEKEEGVPALAGSSPEDGIVRERGAQV